MAGRLLIVGGRSDPSVTALQAAARALDVPLRELWTDPTERPSLTFDPLTAVLWQDARPVDGVAAAFLRADVFGTGTPQDHQAAAELHTVLRGWLACQPLIRRLNPCGFGRSASVNKLSALAAAHRHGLAIPVTMVGNDPRALRAFGAATPAIRKPVAGGDYCRPLIPEALQGAEVLIAQERLIGPEMRVYRVGRQVFGFQVSSSALDYRTDPGAIVSPTPVPEELRAGLLAMTDEMGLDFCASDFKTCPRRGGWVYLETNAAPMFAAFGSDLAAAIVTYLMAG